MRMDIKRAAAVGDLVWIHGHFKNTPDREGYAAIHIFRMENGRSMIKGNQGPPTS